MAKFGASRGMSAGSFRSGGIGRSSFGRSSFGGRSSFSGRSSFGGRSSFTGRSSFGGRNTFGNTTHAKHSYGGSNVFQSPSFSRPSTPVNQSNTHHNIYQNHHHHHHSWWGFGNRYYYRPYYRRGLLYYLLDAIFDFEDEPYNGYNASQNNSSNAGQPIANEHQSKIEEFDQVIRSARRTFEDSIEGSMFTMNPKLQVPMILLAVKILTYLYYHDDKKLDSHELGELNSYVNSRSSRLHKETVKTLKEAIKRVADMQEIMDCINRYDIPMKVVENVLKTVTLYLDHKMKYAEPLKGLYLELSTMK